MASVGVVGATSWGTTLAVTVARKGVDVCLLARADDEAEELERERENLRFLPGAKFPPGLHVDASRDRALAGVDIVIIAVPSRSMRENARAVRDFLPPSAVVVSATKGLERGSAKRMSQILVEELPAGHHDRICALSGPNLAHEIVQGKPSTTVVASPNEDAVKRAQSVLNSPSFRVYTNTDIVGVELGGALKNIVALGAGMSDGLEYGDNAKAAFITRGLAEIARLGVAAGAEPLTLAGLAGMGDLIATCSSPLSRNRRVGEELARGRSLGDILAGMKHVAEGVDTTAAAVGMADSLGVEMPIARAIYSVLFNGMAIPQAVSELMGRAPSPE